LPGALGGQTGWSRHFFDPIPTSDGGELRILRDAGVYILALPSTEAEREHWQTAMEVAAEKGGIVMMAHIAMLRALNHGDPDPAPARRKRAKRYTIVRRPCWFTSTPAKPSGDPDHIKVIANVDAAEKWFEDNDPEGVAFEYEVLE
jgi:hypothetical protein